jgi:hypothetical protein
MVEQFVGIVPHNLPNMPYASRLVGAPTRWSANNDTIDEARALPLPGTECGLCRVVARTEFGYYGEGVAGVGGVAVSPIRLQRKVGGTTSV